jgi:beta-glucosidase
MIWTSRTCAALLIAIAWHGGTQQQTQPSTGPATTKPSNTAVQPESRSQEAWWQARFESINAQVKRGDADLIFIGDSITQGWETEGQDIWKQYYAARKAVNLGISGDRTQHVLWRLDHGNIDGIAPRVAVVMIGTNNSGDNSAEEIAGGVTAIVKRLRAKLPQTRVLLLGIFPRGQKPNPQREKIDKVNALIATLDDGQSVVFQDIGATFLSPDGSISAEIMPDFLHLSSKGYRLWAEAIDAKLNQMMQQTTQKQGK